jgi:sucrose phosphorylase
VSGLEAAITPLLDTVYPGRGRAVAADVLALLERHGAALAARRRAGRPALSERTAFLITYGDALRRTAQPPLQTLAEVLRDHLRDVLSHVHVLPMFPSTSDDGFAVVDHRTIDPDLGTWDDIATLARSHVLMFDFVANHVSASSPWFQGVAGARPGVRRVLPRARPGLRHQPGRATAGAAAVLRARPP